MLNLCFNLLLKFHKSSSCSFLHVFNFNCSKLLVCTYIYSVSLSSNFNLNFILAQPCYFTRQLKSFRDIEHRTVKIDCQVDIEEAIVNWYFEGIEILKGYPDWFDKIREEEDGRERYLIIEDVPREAQGLFECKTNSDETQMKLRVAPVNEFLKPLEDQTCHEKEQVTFECQMLDEEGDAEWRIAGDVVNEDDRIQIKKLDKGVHRLIILRARITDTGDVSCTCVGQNETKAQLMVNKEPPVVEAKDQDADDGKVKAKAKGRIATLYLITLQMQVC